MSHHAPSGEQLLILLAVYTAVTFGLGVGLGAVIWG